MNSDLSDVFVSNTKKLLAHCDKLQTFQRSGILEPITLDISPTNTCNNNCDFCSVKNRDQSQRLELYQAVACTKSYLRQNIRSIEMTGGGEPTMWNPLSEYLEIFSGGNIPIGLITNGIKLHHYSFDNLWKHLRWIRISLNAMDHGWFPDFQIPKEYHGTVSFSYVWHGKSPKSILPKLEAVLSQYPRVESLKIQLDVFNSKLEYPEIVHPKIFIIEKDHMKPADRCYMGWVKPHLDADGYIYHCSTCALRDRKFPMEWRIGSWDHIPDPYPEKAKFDTRACERCFYVDQNKLLDNIRHPPHHWEFV